MSGPGQMLAAKLYAMFAVAQLSKDPKALVLAVLIDFTNAKYGCAWPSVAMIVAVTGLDRRTVQRTVRELEAADLVERELGGGRGNANRYRVRLDAFDRSPLTDPIRRALAQKAARQTPFEGETAADETPIPAEKGRRAVRKRAAGDARKGGERAARTRLEEPGLRNRAAAAARARARGDAPDDDDFGELIAEPLPAVRLEDGPELPGDLDAIEGWLDCYDREAALAPAVSGQTRALAMQIEVLAEAREQAGHGVPLEDRAGDDEADPLVARLDRLANALLDRWELGGGAMA